MKGLCIAFLCSNRQINAAFARLHYTYDQHPNVCMEPWVSVVAVILLLVISQSIPPLRTYMLAGDGCRVYNYLNDYCPVRLDTFSHIFIHDRRGTFESTYQHPCH